MGTLVAKALKSARIEEVRPRSRLAFAGEIEPVRCSLPGSRCPAHKQYFSANTGKKCILNSPRLESWTILVAMNAYKKTPPILWPRMLGSLLLILIAGFCMRHSVAQAPPATPDVIVFTNGDQLTGTLERGVGDSIVFKSDVVGEITVPMAKVKELHSNGSFVVLKKAEKITRTSKQPGTITYADNALTVTNATRAVETIPTKDVGFIVDKATYERETHEPGIWYGWHGGITGSVGLVRSTDDTTTAAAGIALVRAYPTVPYLPARDRETFNLIETYGKSTSPVIPQTVPPTPAAVTKTNIFHTDAEYDKYFSGRLYGLAGLSFDHNYSQGLDLQEIFGGGLGYTAIQTPIQELDVKADVHFERQSFTPPTPSLNLIGSTFAEAYHRNLAHKILFTESGSYIQSWNTLNAYSAVAEVGLTLPTYKKLSMNISAVDNYLNNPAAGYKNNSFQFLVGAVYTLR
jgi:hypothetical protein